MKSTLLFIVVIALFYSCKPEKETALKSGVWHASLEVQDNEILPFTFQVNPDQSITIFNAEEEILIDRAIIKEDSVVISFPVYEGYFAGQLTGENTIKGDFIKESLDRIVPFTMIYSDRARFGKTKDADHTITGIWETVFSADIAEDRYVAKGIFDQKEDGTVTGTFRTTTGDYRYLEGVLDGDKLKLSAFDGAHAFLFTATVTDSTMNGSFYSGNHWKEPFTAVRNGDYELPDENSLTFIKEGYDKLEFSFPDSNGNMVSLSDERFEDKVVLVQILGSWCPNCLDETRYYAPYYKANKDRGLEIIGLNFEYAKTQKKAFRSMDKLKERIGVEYPLLLAQFGTSDKKEAAKKLPMLNHVLSYPTTIFIDKKGNVRKIHTGFNGPATGNKYIQFKQEFESFMDSLLIE